MSSISLWTSLRNPVFRRLWIASVVSGVCVSAHDTAATWAMNTLTPSMFLISVMSTVAALPFFLFTLPAGALADVVDRKKLLCTMNLWLAGSAAFLALLGCLGSLNPFVILISVFMMGTGFAFNAPAWSSVIPEVVSKEELASAVTLGGLQLNVCGIIGPAAGALVLSHFGAPLVFAVNSVCFLLVIAAIAGWQREQKQSKLPLEKFFESFAGAVRYVRYAPGIQVVLARNVLFALFISVIPALLPVVALKEVHIGSADLGLLFTSMGIGSVVGAIVLIPRARARFSPNTLTILASVLLAIVFLFMSVVRDVRFYLGVSALGGVAWTMAASELWVAGQRAMPPWARGRMNATHIMLSQGGMALGGLVWGGSAASLGARFTLMAAAVLLLSSLALAFPLSIDFTGSLNFDPALPRAEYHAMLNTPQPDDGPVTITFDFHIAAVNRGRFIDLMREVRLVHLRNGAFSWRLDEDLAECHVFRVEMLVASWSEHLLQHERITKEEQHNLERAWSLDVRPDGPIVKHFISVNRELLGGKRAEPWAPPPAGHGRPAQLEDANAESVV
ncbi:MAG TPA: MFS transporter [Chthoniobacterales bacterium]